MKPCSLVLLLFLYLLSKIVPNGRWDSLTKHSKLNSSGTPFISAALAETALAELVLSS